MPQLELIAAAPVAGFGIGYMPQLYTGNLRYSTHQLFFRLSIGKLR